MACIIKNCKSHRGLKGTHTYISFHKFPTEKAYLNQWIDAVGHGPDWMPKTYHTICSEHFTYDSFTNPKIPPKHRKLTDSAVPTLNLPHPIHIKKEESIPDLGAYPTMLIVPLTPKCASSVSVPKRCSSKSKLLLQTLIDSKSDCNKCLQYRSQIQKLEKKVEYLKQLSHKRFKKVNVLKQRMGNLKSKNTELVKFLELGKKIVIESKIGVTPKIENISIKCENDV